nr:NAD(P)-binding domain-containing protein [Paenibacillus solanacearum]
MEKQDPNLFISESSMAEEGKETGGAGSGANGRSPVTVLGMGPMGQALAGAFLNNGHPTTVWNRTPGKAGRLVALGAASAATAAEAAAASPLVIVCVLDYDAVHAILEAAGGALNGRAVVCLTADTPERARATAAWAAARGVGYLDGAIMTPAATIGSPAAVVLYSGPQGVYEAHRETLASIGGSAAYLDADPGRAAAYDVALLDLFWTTMSGYAHAVALAGAENIAARDFAVYAQGIAAIMPAIMADLAHQIDEGRYPGSQSNLTSTAAAIDHIIHASQSRGLDVTVLNAVQAMVRRAVDAGHGNDSFSRIAAMLRKKPSA